VSRGRDLLMRKENIGSIFWQIPDSFRFILTMRESVVSFPGSDKAIWPKESAAGDVNEVSMRFRMHSSRKEEAAILAHMVLDMSREDVASLLGQPNHKTPMKDKSVVEWWYYRVEQGALFGAGFGDNGHVLSISCSGFEALPPPGWEMDDTSLASWRFQTWASREEEAKLLVPLLKPGMHQREVVKLLGHPDSEKPTDEGTNWFYGVFYGRAFTVCFDPDGRVMNVESPGLEAEGKQD